MVLLLDDRDPDSHGDVVCAAEKATVRAINFMADHARGLVRLSLPAERCEELQLEVQSRDPSLPQQKAFTISIDARELDGSGISSRNRVKTIRTAVSPECQPSDLVRPGHVLPLRAREGGVLVRAGKTEGSVDLARLAGLVQAGVYCEVLDPRGEPMRCRRLRQFGREHGLKMCTIEDIIEFRVGNEEIVERVEDVEMPTPYGDFRLVAFRSMGHPEPHLALCAGDIGELDRLGRPLPQPEPVLVRVQAECVPGCALGASSCNCGSNLALAQRRIAKEGKGALIFLRPSQGGRLEHAIDDQALGGPTRAGESDHDQRRQDRRDFGLGSQILRTLGLKRLKVMTNSQRKIYGLEGFGLSVVERIPLR